MNAYYMGQHNANQSRTRTTFESKWMCIVYTLLCRGYIYMHMSEWTLFFPTKHGSIPLLYLARVNKRGSVMLVSLQEVDPFAANKHIWLYTIRCYWNPINAIFNEESPCVFLTYGHAKKTQRRDQGHSSLSEEFVLPSQLRSKSKCKAKQLYVCWIYPQTVTVTVFCFQLQHVLYSPPGFFHFSKESRNPCKPFYFMACWPILNVIPSKIRVLIRPY